MYIASLFILVGISIVATFKVFLLSWITRVLLVIQLLLRTREDLWDKEFGIRFGGFSHLKEKVQNISFGFLLSANFR